MEAGSSAGNAVESIFDTGAEVDSRSRRRFVAGLGAVTLLPACGGGDGGNGGVAAASVAAMQGSVAPADAVLPASGAAAAATSVGFSHPGLLLAEADFTRIRDCIKAGEQPWSTWWTTLCANSATDLNGKPSARSAVYRSDRSVYAMYRDIQRAYCCALRWKISQDDRYADLAVATLDAWSAELKRVWSRPDGSSAPEDWTGWLIAGIQGHQWANVGELMRTYSKWAPDAIARFQNMLLTVFASLSSGWLTDTSTKGQHFGSFANWDLAALCGTFAIGVFCDRADLYQQAIDYYKANNLGDFRAAFGNGASAHSVYFMHPGYFGQWQESGRDQGHATLGMSLCGALCEMAWKQGEDLYGFDNNRFLAGAEYVAKSNLLDAAGKPYVMPFARQWSSQGVFTAANNQSYQNLRGCWEPLYNHYVNRMGIDAPNVTKIVAKTEQNYWSGNSDDMVFGTLTHRLPPYAGAMKAPGGLSAASTGGRVVLSWWGSVGAASYRIKRSTVVDGSFSDLGVVVAGDVLTFTDTPPAGVWFYRVEAIGAASQGTVASGSLRVAFPGEMQLSMGLDDGSGATAVGWSFAGDGTRQRVAGTLGQGATWGAGRRSGNAVAFDGQQAYLQLPAGLFGQLSDFTAGMWVYANSLHWDSCLFFIGTDNIAYMRLAPQAGGGHLRFGIAGASYNDEQFVEAGIALPTGRWTHVAVTLQGNTAKLYIDGQVAGSSDQLLLSPRQVGDGLSLLGRDAVHPSFNGRIQDFRVYSRALSDSEIVALAT